jgi:hypothetical protein
MNTITYPYSTFGVVKPPKRRVSDSSTGEGLVCRLRTIRGHPKRHEKAPAMVRCCFCWLPLLIVMMIITIVIIMVPIIILIMVVDP